MSTTSPEIKRAVSCGHEQFPVDTFVTQVRFDAGSFGEFFRIVVMNNESTSHYSSLKEYNHNDPAVGIDDVTSFTLRSSTLNPVTERAIEGFVDSMPEQFNVPQPVTWCEGVRTPAGAKNRLYKATDPDDTSKKIGLLLEQATNGNITALTWYKSTAASALFSTAPAELEFQLVTTSGGAPSTNPNDIATQTWYYTAMGSSCS